MIIIMIMFMIIIMIIIMINIITIIIIIIIIIIITISLSQHLTFNQLRAPHAKYNTLNHQTNKRQGAMLQRNATQTTEPPPGEEHSFWWNHTSSDALSLIELSPTGSMYGIWSYIHHTDHLNVSKYTSPMDPTMGYLIILSILHRINHRACKGHVAECGLNYSKLKRHVRCDIDRFSQNLQTLKHHEASTVYIYQKRCWKLLQAF